MKINKPTIIQRGNEVVYKVHVESAQGNRDLWYSLDREHSDMISDSADAALIALLFPAMAYGEDIIVDSPVSEELYYNLSRPYQAILQTEFGSLKRVKILPKTLCSSPPPAKGVATGFSGGIDSFCVLADHHFSNDAPAGFRLTHLIFNNVGSHGAGGEQLFNTRFSRVKRLAGEIGLPIVAVNSNQDSFYIDLGFAFMDTHSPRNASVAHLLRNGIGRFYYASSYDFKSTAVGAPAGGLPRCDPIALPLLATKATDLVSAGGEYTRVEKTVKVAALKQSYDFLDICVKARQAKEVGKVNCSSCWKCLRTLLTLEIAGAIDEYEKLFDLELYRKLRNRYIASILKSDDPLLREVLDFAEARNFAFPVSSRIYSQTRMDKLFPHMERAVRFGNRLWQEGSTLMAEKLLKI